MDTLPQFFRHAVALGGRWVKTFGTLSRDAALTCLAFLLLLGQAQASFHLWNVNEIYSSGDGSVQFIELRETSGGFGGENGLNTYGASIRVTSPLATNEYFFDHDLVGNTANKTLIIGTANLSSIPGGLTPDYTIPPNFILPSSGNVSFVGFGINYDFISYSNLPTDGDASLVRSGGSMVLSTTNTPKNFNDESNSIVPVKMKSISRSGNDFNLTFATATGPNGTAGPNYDVEFNNTITGTNWLTLTSVGGDGTAKTVTDSNPPDPQRIYRLRVP
ncbi:MAG: hypothetical protein HY298_08400 [Verrucomicrobia bacterium]|nr:hypothetical protein [Verrucomicrobiota bacterium]